MYDTYVQNRLFADPDRSIPRGLENVIFCSGFRGTNKQDEWVAAWRKMQNTSDTTFKTQLINGLGCSDDPIILKDYLESILGAGNSVNYNQAQRRSVFTSVLNSHSGLTSVINFLKDFELEISSSLGYDLENLLTIVARTIKTRTQQIEFSDYLLTLTHLESEAYRRVLNLAGGNLLTQQQGQNAEFLSIIQRILGGWTEETTPTTPITPPTVTPTSPTTQAPTNPPTTQPPTNPPTTQPPTNLPTSPPPTEEPTTVPTSAPTTPAPAAESTTIGASSIGIKLVTLITSIFVAHTLKY